MKQGRGVRGIFGAGVATSEVFQGDHYDETRAAAGDRANFVNGTWDTLLNPNEEAILPVDVLKAHVPGIYWSPAASGVRIPAETTAALQSLWQDHIETIRDGRTFFPDEVPTSTLLTEGATRFVSINVYERNSSARSACIAHYGGRCQVCDMDFEVRYGDIGRGFIHVHHLKQLSAIRAEYVVDPIRDLRPVCPNCHAMLHQSEPPLTITEAKRRLRA